MLARRLLIGSVLVLCLLPALLRADDAEEKAVQTIQRLGGKFNRSRTLPGEPVVDVQPIVLVMFYSTKVTDADLKDIAVLRQLQCLNLNATKVTDAGLKELAPLIHLKKLYLSWTTVTDAGLGELAPFTHLELLYLDSTKVTDAGLKELAALKQLKSLHLMTTPVTAEGVQDLQKALPNCHINWESVDIRVIRESYKQTPPIESQSSGSVRLLGWLAGLGVAVAGGFLWLYRIGARRRIGAKESNKGLSLDGSEAQRSQSSTALMSLVGWLQRTLQSRLGLSVLSVLLLALIGVCVWEFMPVSPRATLTLSDYCELVQFSPDGNMLITAGQSGTGSADGGRVGHRGPIRVWDVVQGVEKCVLATEWQEIRTIRVSSDSRFLAAHPAGLDLMVWDMATGEERANVKPTHFGGIWDSRFSPDGQFLAIQEQPNHKRIIRYWSLTTQQDQGAIEGPVESMVFAPDGKTVGTVDWTDFSKTARILLWNINGQSPKLVKEHRIAANYDVALSPTLQTFATVVFPTKPDELAQITLWDMESGTKLHSFPYGDKQYRRPSLRFSGDGNYLAAHGFCEEQQWLRRTTFWDVTSIPREIGSFPVRAVLSPDGKWLAVPIDNGTKLLTVGTLAEQGVLANPKDQGPIPMFGLGVLDGVKYYPSVTFSPDSKHVAVSGLNPLRPKKASRRRGPSSDDDSPTPIVRIGEVESAREVLGLERCTEILFSSDGKTVGTLHKDNKVRLWNLPATKSMGKVTGVTVIVWLLAASGGWCGTILVRRWKRRFVGYGAILRSHKRMAISMVVLAGISVSVVVVYQSTKQNVPREKVAQIVQSMKAEEVVALLGKPHDGLPNSIARYAPDSYASSWQYADGTVVIWFYSQTNRVDDVSVLDVEPSLFENLLESFRLWLW